MSGNELVRELFDSLIQDKTEKKIMTLIIQGKTSDEIIEELLGIKEEK